MIGYFEKPPTVDFNRMGELIEEMKWFLRALSIREIPNEEYSMEQVEKYILSLLVGQEKSKESPLCGSWCVSPETAGMPSDSRVDFIYQPSYMATAILSIALFDHPITTLLMPGYLYSLSVGLKFCTGRRLSGHGYSADQGAAEAIKILSAGKVQLLLKQNPEYCPELEKIMEDKVKEMTQRLESGDTLSPWGGDQREMLEEAVCAYHSGLILERR